MSVAVDANDNIYISGYYSGEVDFMNDQQKLPAIGMDVDSFLVKLDSMGKALWVHGLGQQGVLGPAGGERVVTAVDGSNDVVLAGNIINTTTIGLNVFTEFMQMGVEPEMFVAKLDGNNGERVWAVAGGDGLAGLSVRDVACDVDGNVIVVGRFEANAGGTLFFETVDPTAAAVYVAKLDGTSGIPIWERVFPTTSLKVMPYGVAVDPSGNIALVGEIAGTLDLGNMMSLVASDADVVDAFVIRLDAGGVVTWAFPYGGTASGPELATDVAVDAAGAVYFTGSFSGAFNFGNDAWGSEGVPFDVFVAKLDAQGNPVWSWASKEPGPQQAWGAALRADRLAVTGWFQNDLPITTPALSSLSGDDLFVGSFALTPPPPASPSVWASGVGGGGKQFNSAVAIGPSGAVVMVGTNEGDIEFPMMLPGAGGKDMVVARFEP